MALPDKFKAILDRFSTMKAERSVYDTIWQQVADYALPRKSSINTEKSPGTEGYVDRLFDMGVSRANLTLAAGITTNSTPATERWFAFSPPEMILNDRRRKHKALQWFEECSLITTKALQKSNFYTEIHEAHLDRNAMGTCAIYISEGKKDLLHFRTLKIGSYCIAADEEGAIDTLIRELKWDARQCESFFGKENLGPKMLRALNENKDLDQKFTVLHAVMPRRERKAGSDLPEDKPIASVWISTEEDHVLRDGGYDEMPYAVSRYLQWQDEVWGWGPGIQCLPIVRQANFIESKLDALAELAVEPRILMPSGMIDDVDLRAGGITAFDPNDPNALPKEWATEGRYDIGMERAELKRKFIRECFHNDLFTMFANLERGITATEAMARVEEKLENFSPTYPRVTNEMLSPLLTRAFSILFRAGAFSEPPPEAYIETPSGMALPMPEVNYTSKISLALKAKENGALRDMLTLIGPIAQVAPEILDIYDFDQIGRDVSHNLSTPPKWVKPEEVVAQIRAERAQQQAQERAAMLAKEAAGAAKDMGSAPPEMREAMAGAL